MVGVQRRRCPHHFGVIIYAIASGAYVGYLSLHEDKGTAEWRVVVGTLVCVLMLIGGTLTAARMAWWAYIVGGVPAIITIRMTRVDDGGPPPEPGKNVKTTSDNNETVAKSSTRQAKDLEPEGYPKIVPKQSILALKNTGKQRRLLVTTIKKRIVAKSDDSEEEDEIPANTIGELTRRLEVMERSNLKKTR